MSQQQQLNSLSNHKTYIRRCASASFIAMADSASLPVEMSKFTDPQVLSYFNTPFGIVALIVIPVLDSQLFINKERTVQATLKGVNYAVNVIGARTLSFTGMIPASTRGLLDVKQAILSSDDDNTKVTKELLAKHELTLTTGHEAVASAMVFNTDKILASTNRVIDTENVAVIGCGHIGTGSIQLLCKLKKYPKHITLVDLVSKGQHLTTLKQQLKEHCSYPYNISIITVAPNEVLNDSLYNNHSLFLVATSAPDIVNIDKLNPGSLIVDDSFPMGFDAESAAARIEKKQDILITVAGGLGIPKGLFINYPNGVEAIHLNYGKIIKEWDIIDAAIRRVMKAASVNKASLTGCIFSSLLTPYYNLSCALGSVTVENVYNYYQALNDSGFNGTPIYFFRFNNEGSTGVYVFAQDYIDKFAKKFGSHKLLRASL